MRITSFTLSIRSHSPQQRLQILPASNTGAKRDQYLTPLDGPAVYISLLGNSPYVPPPILDRPSGLPSNPRLAVGSQGPKKEFMLTPDTLRYLSATVDRFSSQIHEIQLAARAAEARAALQKQEFKRQQEKCREMMDLIGNLGGTRRAALQSKLEKVQDAQRKVLLRLDRTLQILIEQASPDLSEHETKWFDELRRMKEMVAGSGRYDERSLVARAKMVILHWHLMVNLLTVIVQLKREYDRLLPSLKDVQKQEADRKKLANGNQALGLSQAFELGERSTQE